MGKSTAKPKLQVLEKPEEYKTWKTDFLLYCDSLFLRYVVDYSVQNPVLLPHTAVRDSVPASIKTKIRQRANDLLTFIPTELLKAIQSSSNVQVYTKQLLEVPECLLETNNSAVSCVLW